MLPPLTMGFPQETVDWTLDGLFYQSLRTDYFNQDPLAKKIAWDLPTAAADRGRDLLLSPIDGRQLCFAAIICASTPFTSCFRSGGSL